MRGKGHGKPTVINDLSDFDYDGNFIVEGTVGQGKSIFLRYLCARELARGEQIPVFLELRRIEKKEKLLAHVLEICATLGLDLDQPLFAFLASQGRLHLFLDGFDEVEEDLRSNMLTQIERLAGKHPRLRMTISSRPDSGIERSPAFRVFRLAPIEPEEVRHVIVRLMGSDQSAKPLLTALNKSKSDMRNLLTTPLMITLLVITYKGQQRIPDRVAEFYERLFDLLLSRHDGSKPGGVQRHRCGLSDKATLEAFSALCFFAKKMRKLDFTRNELLECAENALATTGHECDEEKFLKDVTKVTCLVVDEGGSYRFIHKSVQEYHTAAFVRTLPEQSAASFYQRRLGNAGANWQQELRFLEEIDRYRFTRYFLIPDLEDFVKAIGSPGSLSTEKARRLVAQKVLSEAYVDFGIKDDRVINLYMSSRAPLSWVFQEALVNWLGPFYYHARDEISGDRSPAWQSFLDTVYKDVGAGTSPPERPVWEMVERGLFPSPASEPLFETVTACLQRLQAARQHIKDEDAKEELFDF